MSYDQGVYYNPEKHGLTLLGMVEEPPSYDFDMFCVWQHTDGRLFYATDSGCSCPSPFEGYTSLEALTPITVGDSFRSFEDTIRGWNKTYDERPKVPKKDVDDLIEQVRAAVAVMR